MDLINFWRSLREMKKDFECLGVEASGLGASWMRGLASHLRRGKRWVLWFLRAQIPIEVSHVTEQCEWSTSCWMCMGSDVSFRFGGDCSFRLGWKLCWVYHLSIIFIYSSCLLSTKNQVEILCWSTWALQTNFCLFLMIISWEQAKTKKLCD